MARKLKAVTPLFKIAVCQLHESLQIDLEMGGITLQFALWFNENTNIPLGKNWLNQHCFHVISTKINLCDDVESTWKTDWISKKS